MSKRMHPRAQVPETCPECGHKIIDVTTPYVPSKPGMMAVDKNWELAHVGDIQCDCDCLEALEAAATSHPKHVCLACSYPIWGYEPEIMVPLKPYGRRYRHVDDAACRRAMNRDYGRRVVSGGLVH